MSKWTEIMPLSIKTINMDKNRIFFSINNNVTVFFWNNPTILMENKFKKKPKKLDPENFFK